MSDESYADAVQKVRPYHYAHTKITDGQWHNVVSTHRYWLLWRIERVYIDGKLTARVWRWRWN